MFIFIYYLFICDQSIYGAQSGQREFCISNNSTKASTMSGLHLYEVGACSHFQRRNLKSGSNVNELNLNKGKIAKLPMQFKLLLNKSIKQTK